LNISFRPPLLQQISENYISVQCRLGVKIVFVLVPYRKCCLYSDDFCCDSTLILTTIAMKPCMDIGARPHVYGVLLMFLLILKGGIFCAWFICPILLTRGHTVA
jgi:hypothetical protein